MILAELRAKLKAAHEAAKAARAKATAEAATEADRTAYKTALDAAEQALSLVKDAEREEALEAANAGAAGGAAGGLELKERNENGDGRVFAQAEEKMTGMQEACLIGAAAFKSKLMANSGTFKSPIEVMSEEGYERFVGELTQRAKQRASVRGQKFSSTLTPADGGFLLPTPLTSTIIEFLRPETTFLQGGPRRVPLVAGQFNQARGATPSTAGYVGEAAKKPVGSPTFNRIAMRSKKLAGIVMVTMEALSWSLADLRAYLETDLSASLAQNMDLACYFGPGGDTTPYGLLKRPGVNTFDASTTGAGAFFSNVKAPTVAEIDAIATRMILAITDYNIRLSPRFRWVMNYHIQQYLINLRGANGQKIYPELDSANPTFKGIGVMITTQFPNNGGTATDESTLALIDFGNVLYGEDEGLTVKTSTEASIDVGTGTPVLLFQQNMMAILMEMRHDIGLNYDQAVSVLNHVRWGSLAA